ncbi:MAG: 4-(cytidine 5'-diphospho)-2-C-methyl-D-erythritol kinase [Synoicihabitans sp.]
MNLSLAVTRRRDDGFHELVSVAAPLGIGDVLQVMEMGSPEITLECDDAAVPTDESNLVVKAARLFRDRSGWGSGAHFVLRKETPMGAGLGGGSSDAVGALIGLNQLSGDLLTLAELQKMSAELGSDCPLFFERRPVVMRGRGEVLTPLLGSAVDRFSDRKLLVIKPPFGVNTAWAFGRMAAQAPHSYLPTPEAEKRLSTWLASPEAHPDELAFNSFEAIVGAKFAALPALAREIETRFGCRMHLSGSGSACYLWPPNDKIAHEIETLVRASWGPESWIRCTEIKAERINS